MTGRIAHIWRHPIKAHGREALDSVDLSKGQTMPWDRAWAVVHERSSADGNTWVSCGHFSRGAKIPELQAIGTKFDLEAFEIELTYPGKPGVRFNPDTSTDRFLDWINSLMDSDRGRSVRLVRATQRGMTDTPFPSVSLLNLASHRAVEQRLGRKLDTERWRGNFVLEGLAPWEEFEWVGRRLKIGSVELKVEEPIGRCQATSVNTATGRREMDMVAFLKDNWGHTDFGVYATVQESGTIKIGDGVEELS